ncbi:MAG: PQQ-like beta-propeller repeat protein, partial [Planctomycetaceae bacterium]|nr:PQQ-like beta-propeller repeat protein [Planctomycetaceae bacterium]
MLGITVRPRWLSFFLIAAALGTFQSIAAFAQFLPPPSLPRDQFSIEIDSAATKQITALRDNLLAGQYAEGVELLLKLVVSRSDKYLELSPGRYVTAPTMAEILAMHLPPEGLRRYREQVDPLARRILEQSDESERNNVELWQRILKQGAASSLADDAIHHLAQYAWERGDIATARSRWEMLIPPRKNGEDAPLPTTFAYPDTDLDLAEIRAKLILCSILLHDFTRADRELTSYRTMHPDSQGELAGTQGKWVDLLQQFLNEGRTWEGSLGGTPALTFAGNETRNGTSVGLNDLLPAVWTIPTTGYLPLLKGRRPANLDSILPSTFPLLDGRRIFWADDESVYACKLLDGSPLWGNANLDPLQPHRIYQAPVSDRPVPTGEILEDAAAFRGAVEDDQPRSFAGLPSFSLTLADGRLFARLRTRTSPLDTSYGQGEPSRLVCLDVDQGEGKLLWEVEGTDWKEDNLLWRFEGTPIAHAGKLYVGLNSTGGKRNAAIAALDATTGERLWLRRLGELQGVGFSLNERLSRGYIAIGSGNLFYETGGGGLAAVDLETGDPGWVIQTPSTAASSGGKLTGLIWDRPAIPVWDRGVVYVLGTEGRSLTAVDGATGLIVWHRDLGKQVQWILGCRGNRIILAGERLWGIDRQDGNILWEVGSQDIELQGYGRGFLSAREIYWPLR